MTTDLWVSALVRRVFFAGDFAAILRRGATEAGAVFVMSRSRLGELVLYGPAPQSSYDSGKPDDRFFIKLAENGQDAVDKRIEREVRFDPDVWLVEVEVANLADLIAIVED